MSCIILLKLMVRISIKKIQIFLNLNHDNNNRNNKITHIYKVKYLIIL